MPRNPRQGAKEHLERGGGGTKGGLPREGLFTGPRPPTLTKDQGQKSFLESRRDIAQSLTTPKPHNVRNGLSAGRLCHCQQISRLLYFKRRYYQEEGGYGASRGNDRNTPLSIPFHIADPDKKLSDKAA